MNPYLVLSVPVNAADEQVRQAYLEAVRNAPPESSPARFKAVTAAYEKIKDADSRIDYILFNREPFADSPVDVLARLAFLREKPNPVPFEELKEFLRACVPG